MSPTKDIDDYFQRDLNILERKIGRVEEIQIQENTTKGQ